MSERSLWIDHFPGNFLWSNATLIIKGMAPYGAVALEEIDRACDRLKVRQGEPQAWWEEWSALAEQVESKARAAEQRGHSITARTTISAGHYHYNAERLPRPAPKSARWPRRLRWYACARLASGQLSKSPSRHHLPKLCPLPAAPAGADCRRSTVWIMPGDEHPVRRDQFRRAVSTRWSTQWDRLEPRRAPTVGSTMSGTAYEYAAARAEVDQRRSSSWATASAAIIPAHRAFEALRACVALSALHWDPLWQQKILDKTQRSEKHRPVNFSTSGW